MLTSALITSRPTNNCICGEQEDIEEITAEGVEFFMELDAKTDRTEEEEEYWRILRRMIRKGNVAECRHE